MLKRIAVIAFMVTLAAVPAFAQKAEVGVTFGWVFADGIALTPTRARSGKLHPHRFQGLVRVGHRFRVLSGRTPKSDSSTQSATTLEVSGTATRDVGDLNVNTYHGTYTYNFGEHDGVRPYLTVGLGATNFSEVSSRRNRPAPRRAQRGSPALGCRREVLRRIARRRTGRPALDTDVCQHRGGRLLVRPVLGLLSRGQREVREPIGIERRHHLPLLSAPRRRRGGTTAPATSGGRMGGRSSAGLRAARRGEGERGGRGGEGGGRGEARPPWRVLWTRVQFTA